jgi:hypothetical protein
VNTCREGFNLQINVSIKDTDTKKAVFVVTTERLCRALGVIRLACEEFVDKKYFQRGVLTRFNQWIMTLPCDRKNLALSIANMASKTDIRSGAAINGIALNEKGKPSLESLVLHYDSLGQGLFPKEAVLRVRVKLSVHNGPRYEGPWP